MEEKPHNGFDRAYLLFAMRIAGDFGISIAMPVILFVLGGQYLDQKHGTTPRWTVCAFILAALLSGTIIYQKAKKYGKEFSTLDVKAKKNDDV